MTSIAVTADAPRRGLEVFGAACREAVRTHQVYLAIILIFVPLAPIIGIVTNTESVIGLTLQMPRFVLLLILFSATIFLGHAVWFLTTKRPKGALLRSMFVDFKARFLQPQRIANFLVVVVPLPLFMSAYNSIKRTIPYINPFSWDPQFAEWDKFLHGGVHPYELLQPLLGTPLVSSILASLYGLWIVVLILTVIWQALAARNTALRMQFFLTYLLVWIFLGNVAAMVFSSAGPVYFDRIMGVEGPYQPLLSYLYTANQEVMLVSVRGYQYLWDVYMAGTNNYGTGISAMPSMHIAMSTLFAIVGWKANRTLGILYTVFAAIMLVGSVHLAWHYAIDGYVSIVCTLALWWAVGRGMRLADQRHLARAAA
jgi:hypothetical protein